MRSDALCSALAQEHNERIVALDQAYRLDRESIAIFPRLPVYAGIGPKQLVTVFVTGNRLLGPFRPVPRG
jgi:hypothetical protein